MKFLAPMALGGAVLLAACSNGPPRAERDDGVVTTAGLVGIFDLAVGDCLELDESLGAESEIVDLPAIPCDEPHHQEIYLIDDVEGFDVYPGPSELASVADGTCLGAFEDYVGAPYLDSPLRFTYLYPSIDSWDEADRGIMCILTSETPLSEPVGGAVAAPSLGG